VDGDGDARAVIMWLDWQFTASNDEMLDPARYQYRETFVLLDARWVISSPSASLSLADKVSAWVVIA
jgi:hypothetical protein